MEIVKLFHPILGKFIYQPKEQIDIQELLRELYEYQELNKECIKSTGLSLAQLYKGANKVKIIDGEIATI